MPKKLKKALLVVEPSMPDYEEYCKAIKSIWNAKWLTNNGPIHNKLTLELEHFLKVPNVTLFVNGHSALDCAMKRLREERGEGEIIMTPFTFVSTNHAAFMNGFTPVFCDIKKSDYTIDESKIEDLITKKTVAILATHVYGYPCNVEEINKIAKKHNLKVIYDAAHAFGVEVDGKTIGNYGDISMFSFHATKVFNTIEGGALVYKDSNLKYDFDRIKDFGIAGAEAIKSIGLNAKMNEFQATMGLLNLRDVKKNINNRKKAVQLYYKMLSEVSGIVLSALKDNVKYNYAYMPILIDEKKFGMDRNQLYDKLVECNIFARKYFYPLISNIDTYKSFKANLPVANYVSDRILCLPLYGHITREDVKSVCEAIKAIRNGK
jgi:dTDP-4-amino-4,6-dideoxygalactose transaminase